MDFHELRLFKHLAGTLHFAKTSRACNISPSALSRTIIRLEEEVGSKLFFRDNRSVELTDSGKMFYNFAQEALDNWAQFRDSARSQEQVLQGELSIYCSVTASYSVLSELFAHFRQLYPKVHIKLQTGAAARAISMITDGIVDITVAARPDTLTGNLRFKTITTTDLVFIAPIVPCKTAEMVKNRNIDWKRLPMVLSEQGLSRQRVDSWFREKGLKPDIYAEVSGHEAILAMVRLGCGVGVVPRLVLEKSGFTSEIAVMDITPHLQPYTVGLCLAAKRLTSPLVRAFWEIVDMTIPQI